MERSLSVALDAVRDAAHVCRRVQSQMVPESSVQKADRSPVTVADFASQAIICQHLRAAFPDVPVVAEESSELLRVPENSGTLDRVLAHVAEAGAGLDRDQLLEVIDHGNGSPAARFWTLDPIDGTKGFLRRGQYAVALGLIENGEVILGALACPELPVDSSQSAGPRGVIMTAYRGGGAHLRPLDDPSARPITIATDGLAALDSGRFVESVESGHADHDTHGQIAAQLGIASEPLRMDSQAKYAAVARGDASVYLRLPSPKTPDYRERIWDHAAGLCVVTEAGGKVTDASGRPLDFSCGDRLLNNQGVVATSGPAHETVIRACVEAMTIEGGSVT